MKRKQFIRNMSLMGAGVVLAPWRLATAKSSIQRFPLPPASIHIPHGNFASAEIEKLVIPEFDLECTVQQFMRNGIGPNEHDLKVYTFQHGDELTQICVSRNGRIIKERGLEQLTIEIPSFESNYFTVLSA